MSDPLKMADFAIIILGDENDQYCLPVADKQILDHKNLLFELSLPMATQHRRI